ncbi:hypothetical protein PACTADRAFT_2638 [Pachysolen tannophilus NRRL Y-2460]|uniref:Enoyl reductase (ER) domain-containing protein n=1 Tax=Pachysolen tannophilus NRRL Y-2460 TaxID=669874 RepID=A0A1E4TX55_PACTA|nr:hypothetical protein PACTADRAFT_2638 [Pachysolen tannophilus NRRL Y-2460]
MASYIKVTTTSNNSDWSVERNVYQDAKNKVSEIHEKEILEFSQTIQSAVVVTDFTEPLSHETEYPISTLNADEILIKNKAIGLNPVDWKCKKFKFGMYHFPWINGRESSGYVVKQHGEEKDLIDERVIVASTSYRDNRTSTFQEYTVMNKRLVWKLPSHITFEDGATIGVGLVTAGVVLLKSFQLDFTKRYRGESLLIWGGSTVVGMYLTQLAKILGLTVISIASKKNRDYLINEIGADIVIDRNNDLDTILKKIYADKRSIAFGVDCFSKETSLSVIDILGDKKNRIAKPAQFVGIVSHPKTSNQPNVIIKEIAIKQFHEDLDFGESFVKATSKFLETGLVKPIRTKVFEGDLGTVSKALDVLQKQGASGSKYVVSLKN